MKGKRKICSGSFTVEASLLMSVIIPLLTFLLYMGIYLHDRTWIRNAALEEAVCMTVSEEKESREKWKGLIGNEKVNRNIFQTKESVIVEVKGSFRMPGMVMHFLAEGKLPLDYRVQKTRMEAKKEIQKLRNLKKLAGGKAE